MQLWHIRTAEFITKCDWILITNGDSFLSQSATPFITPTVQGHADGFRLVKEIRQERRWAIFDLCIIRSHMKVNSRSLSANAHSWIYRLIYFWKVLLITLLALHFFRTTDVLFWPIKLPLSWGGKKWVLPTGVDLLATFPDALPHGKLVRVKNITDLVYLRAWFIWRGSFTPEVHL